MKRCEYLYESGVRCAAGAGGRPTYCWRHDPSAEEYRKKVLDKKRQTIETRYSRRRIGQQWVRREP